MEYVLGDYPDTPEGRLNKHIRATIAEFEREKVIERMVRGRRNKVKAGNVMVHGLPPYGYRVGEVDGKTTLVTHEPEAQIIRLIFAWYVRGDGKNGTLSAVAIARKLSSMGVPTHADIHGRHKKREPGQWNTSVVHRILKSETYAGCWRYGKRNNPGGMWTRNPKDHTVAVEVPAIVSRAVWDAAQVQRAKNRVTSRRNIKREYLLGKRVTCGSCGLKMVSKTVVRDGIGSYSYYICPAREHRRQDYVRNCDAPLFRVDQVDAGAWAWVKELLTEPEAFARGLRKYRQMREEEDEPVRTRLAVVDDLLADNRLQLGRLLDLYLTGDFTKEMLTDRKSRLEKTILALEKERVDLVAQLDAGMLTDAQVQDVKDFMAKVAPGIAMADADFDIRRGVIEALNVVAKL